MRLKIPIQNTYEVLSFSILSDGKEIDQTIMVNLIRVDRSINQVARATIVLRVIHSPTTPSEWREEDVFKMGSSIDIRVGNEGQHTRVFTGQVTGHRLTLGAESTSLQIECEGERVSPLALDNTTDTQSRQHLKADWEVQLGRDVIDFDLSRGAVRNGQELNGWIACPLFHIEPGESAKLQYFSKGFDLTALVSGVRYELKNGEGLTIIQFGSQSDRIAHPDLTLEYEGLRHNRRADTHSSPYSSKLSLPDPSNQDWNAPKLSEDAMQSIHKIERWLTLNNARRMDWGEKRKINSAFLALFHGSSEADKSMVATLISKSAGAELYRISLSELVSKYIGETEKNLGAIFDRAERANWILFFDEADALFGKRTTVRDAQDKYANQEVSYFFERAKQYEGLTILSSHQKNSIDEAHLKHFQAVVHFPSSE